MERQLFIASPHGFCAGVRRAVATVEAIIAKKNGSIIYVYNEIVHNKIVVANLRSQGVEFVNSISDVPHGSTLIFSAHGVAAKVEQDAKERGLTIIDATCPLVTALHSQAQTLANEGAQIILIGHRRHPEVAGTLGRIPNPELHFVVETPEQVATVKQNRKKMVVLTQTTLNNNAIEPVMKTLQEKFGMLELANSHCYATENRQNAVKKTAEKSEMMIIIGSAHSSNSRQLCLVAQNSGCEAELIDMPEEINFSKLEKITRLGLSAGASAPPEVFERTVEILKKSGFNRLTYVSTADEKLTFPLPSGL